LGKKPRVKRFQRAQAPAVGGQITYDFSGGKPLKPTDEYVVV
jgi:hypothetical protein